MLGVGHSVFPLSLHLSLSPYSGWCWQTTWGARAGKPVWKGSWSSQRAGMYLSALLRWKNPWTVSSSTPTSPAAYKPLCTGQPGSEQGLTQPLTCCQCYILTEAWATGLTYLCLVFLMGCCYSILLGSKQNILTEPEFFFKWLCSLWYPHWGTMRTQPE